MPVTTSAPSVRISAPSPIPEEDETRPHTTLSKTTVQSGTGQQFDYYGLRWLFDEDNPTHLPIDEKVLQFEARDLRKTKLYKVATDIFWKPKSRKRVIIARSDYQNRNSNARAVPESRVPQIHSAPVLTKTSDSDRVEDPLEYQTWIAERKVLRENLNSMGLNEAYLSRKPNKTAMERSVLRKMIDARTPKPKPPVIPEDPPYNLKLSEDVPRFRRPCPEAIIVIEEHLSKNKLRLVDLFKNVDKRKKWVVTREEFTDAVKKAGIPLSEMALEDLIVSLDIDMDNCIDYRELVKGMKDWKLQKKRDKQRELAAQAAMAAESIASSKPQSATSSRGDSTKRRSSTPHERTTASRQSTPHERTTASRQSSGPTQLTEFSAAENEHEFTLEPKPVPLDPRRLTPPLVDTGPERMDLDSDESMVSLRKRNRETIKAQHPKKKSALPKTDFFDGRSMIKIGNTAIDNHCRPSTMVGETGVQVDKFRQERLREYQRVIKVCEEFEVPLSEKLLNKVLLYPPDKPQSLLKRKLRQPGGVLVSEQQVAQAVPPGMRPGHMGGGGYGSGGGYMGTKQNYYDLQNKVNKHRNNRHRRGGDNSSTSYDDDEDDDDEDDYWKGRFRPRRNKPRKMYLSTGKAYISRKVDCWMTFDDYERFLSKLEDSSHRIGKCDESAFWPGQLLDKIRLCMPPYTGRHQRPPGVKSVFQDVTKTAKRAYPGYNNDLNLWPVNGRYLMQGRYDPYKNKY